MVTQILIEEGGTHLRKIVQVSVFAIAVALIAHPVSAESDTEDGRNAYPFKPAVETELVMDNPTLEKKAPPLTYTVKSGDTLYDIARAHQIPLQSLMNWSGVTGDLIHPGDVLNVSIEAPGSSTNLQRSKQLVAAAIEKKRIAAEAKPSSIPPATTQHVAKTENKTQAASVQVAAQTGRELTMTATAYTAYCAGCSGTTRTGINLRANPNQKVIAVDPSVIPLGSRVWVEGYGEAIAGDTGGAIKGNKIDVFLPGQDTAIAWGVKTVKVKVLN